MWHAMTWQASLQALSRGAAARLGARWGLCCAVLCWTRVALPLLAAFAALFHRKKLSYMERQKLPVACDVQQLHPVSS
jgi:hypothetical protein